jgi:hypothetical protein
MTPNDASTRRLKNDAIIELLQGSVRGCENAKPKLCPNTIPNAALPLRLILVRPEHVLGDGDLVARESFVI